MVALMLTARGVLPTLGYGDAELLLLLLGLFLSFIITYTIDIFLTSRSVYLVDFACFRPPDEFKITRDGFLTLAVESGNFGPEAMAYQSKALYASGIGDESYMPRTVFRPARDRVPLRESREEAALAMCGAVDDLVAATQVHLRRDVKVLVVNCGVLNTTPSLSAMLINRYKLRSSVVSFNLGGMGCAAGMVAVDLARDLILGPYRGCCALVVSTEAVSATWYSGNELDMLAPNCSIRMGAAAVLLSSHYRDRWRAKYRLENVVRRMVTSAVPEGIVEVETREDDHTIRGLRVGQDHEDALLRVGGEALKANYASSVRQLYASKPEFHLSRTLLQLGHWGHRTMQPAAELRKKKNKKEPNGNFVVQTMGRTSSKDHKQPPFEHACVQATSRRFLDEVQERLGLTDKHMEASRRTLHRFGNTSSSGVWYELAFLEAAGDVARGDRVWQVALGSGFKCNSMTWKALRRIPRPNTTPWCDIQHSAFPPSSRRE